MNFNRELPIMFNGALLNDLITPQFDVDPLLYPETTDATLSFSRGVGEQFNSRKIGIRKIKVPFFMVNPSEKKRHELTTILNVDEPKKLILGRAQDRYYMAIPDGNIETGMAKFQIASTITFICYDPLAYALTTQTAGNKPYKDVPVNLLTGTGYHTFTGATTNGYLSNETTDDFLTLFKGLEGQTVTVSVDYKYSGFVAGSSPNRLGWEAVINADSALPLSCWYSPNNDSGSGRMSSTFVVPKNITGVDEGRGYIQFYGSGTGTLSHLKLEKGSVATPWSPNPADPEYYADTITVDYQGTYPAYPILTATMKSENGLVGFANDKGGVLQFGSPEEVDTVTKQKSDKVIDYGMRPGQTGFTQNVGPGTYTTYVGNKLPNKMQGSVTFDGESANPHYTSDTGVYWHGPTLHGAIPANSNGDNTSAFIWRNRFDFNTDATSLGHLEFTLTSGDKPVLMYTMRDSVGNANQVVSQFWGAGLDQSIEMNPKLFGNGFYEIAISRDNNGGLFTLSKVKALSGDTVVAGSTYKYPFNDSVFQTMPIDGMTVWFQKFSNKKAVNMDWTDSKFTWVNVPYIEDVPNRFDTGDVVTVDVANRKIYVNDVLDNTLQTVGNQWESFALQPGTTTIQPVASSWATMYDCKLTYREAWM